MSITPRVKLVSASYDDFIERSDELEPGTLVFTENGKLFLKTEEANNEEKDEDK